MSLAKGARPAHSVHGDRQRRSRASESSLLGFWVSARKTCPRTDAGHEGESLCRAKIKPRWGSGPVSWSTRPCLSITDPAGLARGTLDPLWLSPDPGPFETQAALSGLCPMRRGPGSDASPLQGPYRCPGPLCPHPETGTGVTVATTMTGAGQQESSPHRP